MEMTLTTIKASQIGMSGFGPSADDAEVFGMHIVSQSSSCEIGCMFLDVQLGDEPVFLCVHIPLEDHERDSTDENPFRSYIMAGDTGLVSAWRLIDGFVKRLSLCESVAQLDRVLIREIGFSRTV